MATKVKPTPNDVCDAGRLRSMAGDIDDDIAITRSRIRKRRYVEATRLIREAAEWLCGERDDQAEAEGKP